MNPQVSESVLKAGGRRNHRGPWATGKVPDRFCGAAAEVIAASMAFHATAVAMKSRVWSRAFTTQERLPVAIKVSWRRGGTGFHLRKD